MDHPNVYTKYAIYFGIINVHYTVKLQNIITNVIIDFD